jgi:hypothetical protein
LGKNGIRLKQLALGMLGEHKMKKLLAIEYYFIEGGT